MRVSLSPSLAVQAKPDHTFALHTHAVLQEEVFKDVNKAQALCVAMAVSGFVSARVCHLVSAGVTASNLNTTVWCGWENNNSIIIRIMNHRYEKAVESSPRDCMVLNDFANFTNRSLKHPQNAVDLCVPDGLLISRARRVACAVAVAWACAVRELGRA